jgi:serine/threonine protein kinase
LDKAVVGLYASRVGDGWEQLRIVGVVHEGARRTLYRALRSSDGLAVLLSVARGGYDGSKERAAREHELGVVGLVDSPFVVKAQGLTEYEGRVALVLDDFGGEVLRGRVGSQAPLETTLSIAVRIADALAAVHGAGVVHGDVKTEAVLFRASTGEVKLTGFDIAVARGEVSVRSSDELEGTLAYMAPEQAGRLRRHVDRRADLYSFGVVLYELFTGQLPFQASDPLQWIHCHLAQVPRAPAEVTATVPDVLSQIILKLLAKAPEERYQTAAAVSRDLSRCRASAERGELTPSFVLAESDVSDEFQLVERVYGRDREIESMTAAFERAVNASRREVILVSGYSGVGKTSLVRELHPAVARRAGLFASGKFDQYRRHIPYAVIAQIGSGLVRQLLTRSHEQLTS